MSNTKQLTIYEGKTVHGIVRRNNGSQFLVNRIDILRNRPTLNPNMPDLLCIRHSTDHTESYMPLCIIKPDGTPYEATIRIYTKNPSPQEIPNMDMGPMEMNEMFMHQPASYSIDAYFASYTPTPDIMKETNELHIIITVPHEATLTDFEEIYAFNIGCMRSDQINDNTQLSSRGTPVSPSMRTVSATLVIRGWDMTLDFHID